MSLKRILEPEAMDTADEALAYDAMDHSGVNLRFVVDLISVLDDQHIASPGTILDLGTGTALIPIELCRHHDSARVVAIDVAESMLQRAKVRVAEAGLKARITLQRVDSKSLPFDDGQFDVVMSNSIVHHIPNPMDVIREAVRVARHTLFFRDLMRPDTEQQLESLVEQYAGQEAEHAQSMFRDSLHAALSLDEMRELVQQEGFSGDSVQATSDRHWTWTGIKTPTCNVKRTPSSEFNMINTYFIFVLVAVIGFYLVDLVSDLLNLGA